jgi:hypothetical protein
MSLSELMAERQRLKARKREVIKQYNIAIDVVAKQIEGEKKKIASGTKTTLLSGKL